MTGLPKPNTSIVIAGLSTPHVIDVKYNGAEGKEQSPFHVAVDSQHDAVSETKDVVQGTAAAPLHLL